MPISATISGRVIQYGHSVGLNTPWTRLVETRDADAEAKGGKHLEDWVSLSLDAPK